MKYKFTESKATDEINYPPPPPPPKNAVGSDIVKFPINVFSEFGNIKAVIVGYMDKTSSLPPKDIQFIVVLTMKTL